VQQAWLAEREGAMLARRDSNLAQICWPRAAVGVAAAGVRGIVKPRRRPATIKEMSEAAAAGAAADALPRRR
jgi:hypothetical protein